MKANASVPSKASLVPVGSKSRKSTSLTKPPHSEPTTAPQRKPQRSEGLSSILLRVGLAVIALATVVGGLAVLTHAGIDPDLEAKREGSQTLLNSLGDMASRF